MPKKGNMVGVQKIRRNSEDWRLTGPMEERILNEGAVGDGKCIREAKKANNCNEAV